MKVILSRKGFDSGFGEIASPILPDGTLLSMLIPTDDIINYSDLSYKGKKYSDILKELKPTFKYKTCHLDPDIRKDCKAREDNWVPAFGQSDAALSHLNNHHVDEGDLFLYFGWFRQTEYDRNGKLRFFQGAPDLQVIYGYLQVGKVCRTLDDIKKSLGIPMQMLEEKI